MKKFFLILLFYFAFHNLKAQSPGQWTWIKGDSSNATPGIFGTKGVPDINNHPPALYETGSWIDNNGNFWIFGGLYCGSCSPSNNYGDMWKYDPVNNMWTWMSGPGIPNTSPNYGTKGVASAMNQPGSRSYGMFNWIDKNGDLWLFGGFTSSGYLNDLWKYNISSNMWTWVSGNNFVNAPGNYGIQGIPSINNIPPARSEMASAWVDDNGNLWLFSGRLPASVGTGSLNDLWKFDIATNEWTWMKGSNTLNAPPNHGVKGVSSISNDPGARCAYSHWKDKSGNLWFFGGASAASWSSAYNDMWKYDINSNMWTWMHGSNVLGNSSTGIGIYNGICNTGTPGPRFENRACWTDACGKFWMMGGDIYYDQAVYNDFWQYDPVTNVWKLIYGGATLNQNGFYGTQGVSSSVTYPGSRCGASGEIDKNGNLWFFGGLQYRGKNITLGDLWRYVPDPNCGGCELGGGPKADFKSSDTLFCGERDCIDFFDLSTGNPTSWKWYFSGAVPNTSSQQNPKYICYNDTGSYDVLLVVSNANGSDSVIYYSKINIGNIPKIPVIFRFNDTLFCTPSAFKYQWYRNDTLIPGATDSFYVPLQPGFYTVYIWDKYGCSISSAEFLITGMSTINPAFVFTIYPNPTKDFLEIQFNKILNEQAEVRFYDVVGKEVMRTVLEKNTRTQKISTGDLVNGIYFLQIIYYGHQLNYKIIIAGD